MSADADPELDQALANLDREVTDALGAIGMRFEIVGDSARWSDRWPASVGGFLGGRGMYIFSYVTADSVGSASATGDGAEKLSIFLSSLPGTPQSRDIRAALGLVNGAVWDSRTVTTATVSPTPLKTSRL